MAALTEIFSVVIFIAMQVKSLSMLTLVQVVLTVVYDTMQDGTKTWMWWPFVEPFLPCRLIQKPVCSDPLWSCFYQAGWYKNLCVVTLCEAVSTMQVDMETCMWWPFVKLFFPCSLIQKPVCGDPSWSCFYHAGWYKNLCVVTLREAVFTMQVDTKTGEAVFTMQVDTKTCVWWPFVELFLSMQVDTKTCV